MNDLTPRVRELARLIAKVLLECGPSLPAARRAAAGYTDEEVAAALKELDRRRRANRPKGASRPPDRKVARRRILHPNGKGAARSAGRR